MIQFLTLIARAEWRRLVRERANVWVLIVFSVLLMVSAVSSGLAAREWRADTARLHAEWTSARAKAADAARVLEARQPRDEQQAMMAAFQFARGEAPPAVLPALGGLALGTGGFELLAPTLRVTVESRHTDGRKGERLDNPLLDEFGALDFATSVALLLPLALIGLGGGMVQHSREHGTWRLVVAQCSRPGTVFGTALGLRAAAIWSVAALASALAFLLDPGATAPVLADWLVTLFGFVAVWTAVVGILCLLPVSSAAAILSGLAVWLLTTFAMPAGLAWAADRVVVTPSRLAAITQIRTAQQEAEVHMDELMAEWYARHPEARHPSREKHTWPVTFMPRYVAQDAEIRPLMVAIDEARASRYEAAGRWSWLSPSLSLVMVADGLAGIDAPRYARHVASVNRFEDAWRDFFVPRIMSYRGLSSQDYSLVPMIEKTAPASARHWHRAIAMTLLAVAGFVVLFIMRRRLSIP